MVHFKVQRGTKHPGEEENPYGAYLSRYRKTRERVEASGEEIDDALITAMGTPSQMVPESLRSLHDFVRQSIKEGMPLNWVFQAEHDVREVEKIGKHVVRLGEELSARVVIHSEGGGLGRTRAQHLCREIGRMVAAGMIAELGSAAVDLREHHISSITAEVREDLDGMYTAAFTVEGQHPQLGLPLSAQGTARIQAE